MLKQAAGRMVEIRRSKLRKKTMGFILQQGSIDSLNSQLKENWKSISDNENSVKNRESILNAEIADIDRRIYRLNIDFKNFPEDQELLQTIDYWEKRRFGKSDQLAELKTEEAQLWHKRGELEQQLQEKEERKKKVEKEIQSIVEGFKIEIRKPLREKILQYDKEEDLINLSHELGDKRKLLSYQNNELESLFYSLPPGNTWSNILDKHENVKKMLKIIDDEQKLIDQRLKAIRKSIPRKIFDVSKDISEINSMLKSATPIGRQALQFYQQHQEDSLNKELKDFREAYTLLMLDITKDIKPKSAKQDLERVRKLHQHVLELQNKKIYKLAQKESKYFPGIFDELNFIELKKETILTQKQVEKYIKVFEHQESKLMARDCNLLQERLKIIDKAWEQWKRIRKFLIKIRKEANDYELQRLGQEKVLTDERNRINGLLRSKDITEEDKLVLLRLKERVSWELERVRGEWNKSSKRIENITVRTISEYPESIQNVRTKIRNERRHILNLLNTYCLNEKEQDVSLLERRIEELNKKHEELIKLYEQRRKELEEKMKKELSRLQYEMEMLRKTMEEDTKGLYEFRREVEYRKNLSKYIETTVKNADAVIQTISIEKEKAKQIKELQDEIYADIGALILTFESTVKTCHDQEAWKEQGYILSGKKVYWGYQRGFAEIYLGRHRVPSTKFFKTLHVHPLSGGPHSPTDLKNLTNASRETSSRVLGILKNGELVLREVKREVEELEREFLYPGDVSHEVINRYSGIYTRRLGAIEEFDRDIRNNLTDYAHNPDHFEHAWKKYIHKMDLKTRIHRGTITDIIVATIEDHKKDYANERKRIQKIEDYMKEKEKIRKAEKELDKMTKNIDDAQHDLIVIDEFLNDLEISTKKIGEFINKEIKNIEKIQATADIKLKKIRDELIDLLFQRLDITHEEIEQLYVYRDDIISMEMETK